MQWSLWGTSLIALLLAAVVLFLVAAETGFRLGARHREDRDEPAKTHVGALQSALLGLLGLLLAFTFAMAVSRFDTRKALVVEESNAIGTTALRARLLPAPQRQEVAGLLKEYVTARLASHDAHLDPARLEAASAATSRLQERLWAAASAAATQDPRSVPTGLFIESLNEAIDVTEKRRAAVDNHVPETVAYLLLAVAVAALGFVGYGCGLSGRRRAGSNLALALLIALVLVIILDLDRPRRGLIRVSQESMIRLKAALDQAAP